jgi:hypothetical protein
MKPEDVEETGIVLAGYHHDDSINEVQLMATRDPTDLPGSFCAVTVKPGSAPSLESINIGRN